MNQDRLHGALALLAIVIAGAALLAGPAVGGGMTLAVAVSLILLAVAILV